MATESGKTGTAVGSSRGPSDAQRRLRLSHALVSMSLKVARRSGEDEQIEAKLELYADQLMGWPERVALAVLAEHPRRSIYWPAWKELEDLRAELQPPTPRTVAPEHRLLPPAGAKPEGQEPFAIRREWDDFADAMRKLRDPAVPMLGREQLLKIGGDIEARQRPHAQRMGWA